MNLNLLKRRDDYAWEIPPHGAMHVPAVIYADADLLLAMDHKVYEQAVNVAALSGGVVSTGGVGFDISCGVRSLHTGLRVEELLPEQKILADALYYSIPAGVGSTGGLHLDPIEMDRMLRGGAQWAVQRGYGEDHDLERIEERGRAGDALPAHVSAQAKLRQRDEMGTLGSGNHYLEVQKVTRIFATDIAQAYKLREGDVLISIHCGSRGLGHQIGTDYLKKMLAAAPQHGISLPDRELACAPLRSALGAPPSTARSPTARFSRI